MKISKDEKEALSTAIDKMNEGLDVFIQFYNEAEEDVPLVDFSDDTAKIIERAADSIGREKVSNKINTIVKEMLSFFDEKKD
ncbi:protein mistic [Metabacillus sp. GX 13764]|uniref:protein mistic n=1 Tax=Metabacillus kandeliae TaxID=2900151 RepID=UPI001E3D91C1|nr:protein mistic [Metabacillus kandeliae]MCD7035767.1 protein mistic [Metabacillus kandeliae]